jgi:hypothetical protein
MGVTFVAIILAVSLCVLLLELASVDYVVIFVCII